MKESEKKNGQKYRKRGLKREEALEALQEGKKLSKAELLRGRVRYFSDGLVLGSQAFVEEAFAKKREWFGAKQKTGARELPALDGDPYALRKLKIRAVE